MGNSKLYDVCALGELLIDFTCNGTSESGNKMFEANPGGAPCNVLALLSKHGKCTAFIGKVGDDMFGHSLKCTIEEVGISSDGLVFDKQYNTTLAFVETKEDGDRDFSFYRNPGADMMLLEDEVDGSIISNSKIFHFGSLSLTHDGVARATKKAVLMAKEHGAIISFDPNLREPLWDDLDEAKRQMEWGISQCDILKIAKEELSFITGENDIASGIKALKERYNVTMINVTDGKEGSWSFYKDLDTVRCEGFLLGNTIETTGAGDTFCGCVLNYVLEHGLDKLGEANIKEMLTYANAAAYLVTTKRGAIKSMPAMSQVEKIVAH